MAADRRVPTKAWCCDQFVLSHDEAGGPLVCENEHNGRRVCGLPMDDLISRADAVAMVKQIQETAPDEALAALDAVLEGLRKGGGGAG